MSGLEVLASRLGGCQPFRTDGPKVGCEGCLCPSCGEPKFGVDYKPHQDGDGRLYIEVGFCWNCGATLPDAARAVGMTQFEVEDGNELLLTKYADRPKRRPRPPSMDQVEEDHLRLTADADALRYVTDERHVSLEVVRANWLGLDANGLHTFPLLDHYPGYIIPAGIRRYDRSPAPGQPKMKGPPGLRARIYPTLPTGGRLIACEGEWDALVLDSMGFPAVTNTAGARARKVWRKHPEVVAGRDVWLLFDRDAAGELGAEQLAPVLLDAGARSVYIAKLPMPFTEKHGADVTDFVRAGAGPDDIRAVLNDAYRRRTRDAGSPGAYRGSRREPSNVAGQLREEVARVRR